MIPAPFRLFQGKGGEDSRLAVGEAGRYRIVPVEEECLPGEGSPFELSRVG